MKVVNRIKRNEEFAVTVKKGSTLKHSPFIIHYLKNDKEYKRESSKKDLVNSIITNYPYFSQISSIKN